MTETDLLGELHSNPFVLAPMAGITDCAFRSFMKEMGCGVVVTELVSANGLHYESERTRQLMKFEESQRPVGIQIFGEQINHLVQAAKICEQMGADFVDLNFGCPVPKVVNKGAGSAMLRDLKQMAQTLNAVKSAISIPLTIKIRTGWNEQSKNSVEVTRIAKDEGVTWVAIHGRTRAAGYSGKADWDYIASVKNQTSLPILGNGDINSPQLAVQRWKQSGCDAVMIGRGCLKNPWIFRQSRQLIASDSLSIDRDFCAIMQILTAHLENHYSEKITLLQLKKLSSWFSAGYPNSSQFRQRLFSTREKSELMEQIFQYFQSIRDLPQLDTSHEAFLMGGHG